MTVTACDLIKFGYCRRHYNEVLQDCLTRDTINKDIAGKTIQHGVSLGRPAEVIKLEIDAHNRNAKVEAEFFALGVIEVILASLVRRGMTEEEIMEWNKT